MKNNSFYKNITIALSILLIIFSGLIGQESGAVPTREEMDINFTWDLSYLYDSDEAWEDAF